MAKQTVLVVDDEPILRMVASGMLEDAGCRVVEFGTADDAICFCADPRNAVAAVLTDVRMPGATTGLELASLVSETRPEAVVVVTSGHVGHRPADLAPSVRFMVKPWCEADLLSALENILSAA